MYIERTNQDIIYKLFAMPFITAVLGSRRVGKSTLVQHFIAQTPKHIWINLNMDSLIDRKRIEANELRYLIEENAQKIIQENSDLWIAIDEAQKCPLLFEQIKMLYDQFKGKNALKFILTGSGFLNLHQLSAETLAGRIDLKYLREFNLKEHAMIHNQSIGLAKTSLLEILCDQQDINETIKYINHLRPFKPILEKCLREQLIWGGLPEVLLLTDPAARKTYIANYLQTYLERDVRAITNISDLNLYQNIMEIIAEQTGSLRDEQKTLQALNCARDTLKKYRHILESTLLYFEVYPYSGSTLRRLVKSPKGYLLNNGLVSYLTGLYDITLLEKTGTIGHRLENWFLKELQIWLDRDPAKSKIYFWRTSSHLEVDFVVEKKPYLFPFEVTSGTQIDKKKLSHLLAFLREEKTAPFGFYIYNGEFRYDAEKRICFIPTWTIV